MTGSESSCTAWVVGVTLSLGLTGCDPGSWSAGAALCIEVDEAVDRTDADPALKGRFCQKQRFAVTGPTFEPDPPVAPSADELVFEPTVAALDEPLTLAVRSRNLRPDAMVRMGGQEARLTRDPQHPSSWSAVLRPPFAHQDFSAWVEVKNPGGDYQRLTGRLSFFVGNPVYRYATPATGGPPQFALGLGDFTGDGVVDIVRADSEYPSKIRVYKLSGTFPEDTRRWFAGFPTTDLTYQNPDPSDQPSFSALASGDFDLDGDLDLALSQFHSGQVRLMWNDGSGYFPKAQQLAVGDRLTAIAAADLNEDGRLDLAALDENSGQLAVLLWEGPKRFTAPHYVSTAGIWPEALQLVDLDRDGHLDAVVANQGSSSVSVLHGDGKGGFAAATSFPTCTGPISVAVANLNGDQQLDVVTGCPVSGQIGLLLATLGSAGFAPVRTFDLGRMPFGVAVADLNHDQRMDIVVGHLLGGHVSLIFQEREGLPGRFLPGRLEPAQVIEDWRPAIVATHDLNRDGLPDVIVGLLQYGGLSISASKL